MPAHLRHAAAPRAGGDGGGTRVGVSRRRGRGGRRARGRPRGAAARAPRRRGGGRGGERRHPVRAGRAGGGARPRRRHRARPLPPHRAARVVVALAVGPEVLTGSTRLKAGTATKLALNTLTTATFVRLGKVYGNRMVDLEPRSAKLRARALRLVGELGGVPPPAAARLLAAAGGRAKPAKIGRAHV